MTLTLSPDAKPYATLTLTDVDTLHRHAHRVVLYGTLMANVLEGQYESGHADFTEELLELVGEMIADAEAVKTVLKQCDRVERGAGDAEDARRDRHTRPAGLTP